MDTVRISVQQASATVGAIVPPKIGEEGKSNYTIIKRDQRTAPFDRLKVFASLRRASACLGGGVALDLIEREFLRNIFDQITTEDIERALILAATSFIERDPAYDAIAARLLLQKLYKEVIGRSLTDEILPQAYRETFVRGIHIGIEGGKFDPRLAEYDFELLCRHLRPERDSLFTYLGIQTLYGRYLKKINDERVELPQTFWMRVAMGLAIDEPNREERTLEFYEVLSTLKFISSTPTLFHSGTTRPQLSSCFLTTVGDDLHNIFKSLSDNAQLSKWSGGIANDWTNIRSAGARIKSIDIKSTGVVPFLKIANDITGAINRSGNRHGAGVVYLESWHYDIEDFLDLRRNTGDERRRTHDLNTANWIPDLFMKRVQSDGNWTLFSPHEVPDLHDLYGAAFEKRYIEYEELAREGKIELFKVLSAAKLWRKMLSRLFETGHPWIVFKDAANVRSPQDHAGVVHSSNLCTEITLNTSEEETAVCNLGSINLGRHINDDGTLDRDLLAQTVRTAVRMLDNVIDINFYPTPDGKLSNSRHRPVGLGLMGFQDALFKSDIPFDDQRALTFADETMEYISYHAILTSSQLAKEKGTYKTYKGSKWDRDIFPIDTLELLEQQRGAKIEVDRTSRMDWRLVRQHVQKYGMRNSNVMAVAPTATISNVAGAFPCIEPMYKNAYVKANVDGEFTVINTYLVEDLKKLGLWSKELCDQIKYYDGSVQHIKAIPQDLRRKYKVAFEIDPEWLIKITAARGKWIDQSQSHNVFMQGVSGTKLNEIYFSAWRCGLKSTYYLRSLGASQVEKSTLDAKKYGYTQKREYKKDLDSVESAAEDLELNGNACSIETDGCESCQ